MNDRFFIVFVKNPALGKVKTRLAKTVGDERALEIYRRLLTHTRNVVSEVDAKRTVWYSHFVDNVDLWPGNDFAKYLQDGDTLGERMMNAFATGFSQGYQKVMIVGSDCPGITPELIEQGYKALDDNEVVFGPAEDGGYYLLGMSQLYMDLFQNKKWSTENVLLDSILDLQKRNVKFATLEPLSDVDFEADLANYPFLTDPEA